MVCMHRTHADDVQQILLKPVWNIHTYTHTYMHTCLCVCMYRWTVLAWDKICLYACISFKWPRIRICTWFVGGIAPTGHLRDTYRACVSSRARTHTHRTYIFIIHNICMHVHPWGLRPEAMCHSHGKSAKIKNIGLWIGDRCSTLTLDCQSKKIIQIACKTRSIDCTLLEVMFRVAWG